AECTTLKIDGLTLTRVLYADAMIAPERAGLTVDDVRSVPWRRPMWASDDELGASASAWVVEGDGRRIVLEPLQAADDLFYETAAGSVHHDAFAAIMQDAG